MGFVFNYALNYTALLAGREPRRPLFASWYVTHRCPLDCIYCSDGEGQPFHAEKTEELSTEDGKRLVSLIRKSTTVFDVTGGEPMVREDLEELLRHAKAQGLTTILNTKGIGIGERPELVESCDVLVLSVETLEVDKLAGIIRRPRETAQKLLQALEDGLRLTRARKKKMVVSLVAMPGNLDDIGPVLRWCLQHGAVFQIAPQMVGMLPPKELYANPRYQRAMDEVIEAKVRTNLVVGAMGYLKNLRELKSARCTPLLLADIRPDGGLYYPCIELKYFRQNVLAHGGIDAAQRASARDFGPVPTDCGERCQIFCHMALSMAQGSLVAGLAELKTI